MLIDLFVSKVRVKLIQIFLRQPNVFIHVRDLVRTSDEQINAVRRELKRMEERGMVKKEPRGNRLYYWFRKDYKYYPELLALTAKTTDLGRTLIRKRQALGKIKYAALNPRLLTQPQPDSPEQLDFFIIGQVVLPELEQLVKKFELKLKREINYTVIDAAEFEAKKRRRDPFVYRLLIEPRVMLIGDELSLAKIKD